MEDDIKKLAREMLVQLYIDRGEWLLRAQIAEMIPRAVLCFPFELTKEPLANVSRVMETIYTDGLNHGLTIAIARVLFQANLADQSGTVRTVLNNVVQDLRNAKRAAATPVDEEQETA